MKMIKMTENEMLKMIAQSNTSGFNVPVKTLLSASSNKIVAKMFDSGLLDMHKTAYGYMYSITEKGLAAII